MSGKNSVLLGYNCITEDWTKKDWALNLLPLGGIASVTYEIGSACLSSRARTTKISQDFFKSPIPTTLKKLAQCLWAPIVICGVFKLICMIVTACWNHCFPPANNKPKSENQELTVTDKPKSENNGPTVTNKDPFEVIPSAVTVYHIFSYLDLHNLGVSERVSKKWNTVARTPILRQKAIYREIAFNSKHWAQWDDEIVRDVDFTQEHLSLPENIEEELRRSYKAFPGKRIVETHVLVRIPQGLTIKKLEACARKYLAMNDGGRREAWPTIGLDEPTDEPAWLLITAAEINGTKGESYAKQKDIIAALARKAQVPYEVPTTLEAIAAILATYLRSKKRLFADDPWSYTRCQESIQGYQVIVGGFSPVGFRVNFAEFDTVGVAARRKWPETLQTP